MLGKGVWFPSSVFIALNFYWSSFYCSSFPLSNISFHFTQKRWTENSYLTNYEMTWVLSETCGFLKRDISGVFYWVALRQHPHHRGSCPCCSLDIGKYIFCALFFFLGSEILLCFWVPTYWWLSWAGSKVVPPLLFLRCDLSLIPGKCLSIPFSEKYWSEGHPIQLHFFFFFFCHTEWLAN